MFFHPFPCPSREQAAIRARQVHQPNSLQCYIEYQSARDVQNIVSGIKNDVECRSVVAVGGTEAAAGDGKGKDKAGASGTGGSH